MIVDRVAERFRNARYRQIPQTHRPTYASYSAIDRTTEGIQARARAREEQDRQATFRAGETLDLMQTGMDLMNGDMLVNRCKISFQNAF